MKSLLLLAIVSSVAYGTEYEVSNKVIGYICPSGYTYRSESGLCYLDGNMDSNTSGATVNEPSPGIPHTVRRRKELDKKALARLLDGKWIQEEPIKGKDPLELTE